MYTNIDFYVIPIMYRLQEREVKLNELDKEPTKFFFKRYTKVHSNDRTPTLNRKRFIEISSFRAERVNFHKVLSYLSFT